MTDGMSGFHPPDSGDVQDGGRQPQNAPSPNVPGRQAIKVDVPSGAMRSEIEPGDPTAHIQSGSHMFFGLSDFIPQGFPVDTSGYQVIWQLHDGGTNSSPPVALEVQAGHLRLANVGNYIADLGPVTAGQNLAIQIEVQFAEGGGSVSVWVNGKQVATNVKPPKGTMVDSYDYLKLGVYKHKTSEDADASLFINDVKVGNSLESVSNLAGATAGNPAPSPAGGGQGGGAQAGSDQGGSAPGDGGQAGGGSASASGDAGSGGGTAAGSSGTSSSDTTGGADAGTAAEPGGTSTGSGTTGTGTGTASTGTASTTGPEAAPATPAALRDVRRQPFSWDSVWNLPLATAATYQPAGVRADRLYPDIENISIDPGAPVKQLSGASSGQVHVAPDLTADGHWNNCSTLLLDTPEKTTVIQGQPMKLTAGGDPSWAYGWAPVSLTSTGEAGCHGGSGLSGIGGTIREGELTGPEPIRHALKISLPCERACSAENDGHRWPATKADSGFQDHYGGSNAEVLMGSLLALPADADLTGVREPDVRKVAEALRTYGGYVVDSSGGPTTGSFDVQSTAVDQFPNIDADSMRSLFAQLQVITDNAAATPGGGALDAPRRAPCARPFTDGSGAPPSTCGGPAAPARS